MIVASLIVIIALLVLLLAMGLAIIHLLRKHAHEEDTNQDQKED